MSEKESWKPIIGYEDYYLISNFGKVLSIRTGKLKSLRTDPQGYRQLDLYVGGSQKTNRIHRLVAIHFVENPLDKPAVNHLDGDKDNNRWDNLAWCTPKENTTHAYANGLLNNIGENNPQSKLTNEDVVEIRKFKGILFQSTLARMFGVSQTNISRIQLNKKWKV